MAKKVVGQIKLQIPAGAANPSPPVGPALGQRGVNIMEFCKAFNAQTQAMQGLVIPVIVTVYADRSLRVSRRRRGRWPGPPGLWVSTLSSNGVSTSSSKWGIDVVE